MHVLFLEKNMSKASPLITQAKILKSFNTTCEFIDFSQVTTKELISSYLKADVAVLQHYGRLGNYEVRQLALASFFRVPLVRNWAGSDALNVVEIDDIKEQAQKMSKFISYNVTDSHLGLVQELSTANISCDSIPQLVNLTPKNNLSNIFVKNAVLAYLPSERNVFYGSKYIENLIKNFPNVTFHIVGDTEHSLSCHTNVVSHGWVNSSDMENIWNNIGILIRITEHDGTPRMIYEALNRGKYVIHNNKHLEAIWYAQTDDEIKKMLQNYLAKIEVNKEGLQFINNYFKKKPEQIYFNYLSNTKASFKTQLTCAKYIIKDYLFA